MKKDEIRKGLDDLSNLQFDMMTFIDYLRGFDTLIVTFYKHMLETQGVRDWQDDPEKYIEILSTPYQTIMENSQATIKRLKELEKRLDYAIMDLDRGFEDDKESA